MYCQKSQPLFPQRLTVIRKNYVFALEIKANCC